MTDKSLVQLMSDYQAAVTNRDNAQVQAQKDADVVNASLAKLKVAQQSVDATYVALQNAINVARKEPNVEVTKLGE